MKRQCNLSLNSGLTRKPLILTAAEIITGHQRAAAASKMRTIQSCLLKSCPLWTTESQRCCWLVVKQVRKLFSHTSQFSCQELKCQMTTWWLHLFHICTKTNEFLCLQCNTASYGFLGYCANWQTHGDLPPLCWWMGSFLLLEPTPRANDAIWRVPLFIWQKSNH